MKKYEKECLLSVSLPSLPSFLCIIKNVSAVSRAGPLPNWDVPLDTQLVSMVLHSTVLNDNHGDLYIIITDVLGQNSTFESFLCDYALDIGLCMGAQSP